MRDGRPQGLEALLAAAPDVVIRFDRDLRHLFINRAVETVTGQAPEYFLGRTNRELGMPEELCVLWERELGAVFESGQERRFEFTLDGIGGSRALEAYVVPERNAAGEVETILSFTRDRTESRRAEQDTRASEARYRELFEQALELIVLFDLDGLVVDLNPAAERTLGYRHGELVGRPLAAILAPEERDAAARRLASKLDGSDIESIFESVLLGKDGARIPIEATSKVVLRDGALNGVILVARDVRDRDASLAAVEASEQRFRGAFDGVAVGMVIADQDAVMLRVNAAFAEMVGYSTSELTGMRVDELVHPDDRDRFRSDITTLQSGLGARRTVADRRYVRKDGETIYVHVSVSAVIAADGTTEFLAAQVEDVSELRQTQLELQEIQTLHQAVIESSHDVLGVLDLDDTIRLVSHSVGSTLGYSEQELVRRSLLEFVHPDDRHAVEEAIQAAKRGETALVVRSRIIARDGGIRLWDGSLSPGLGGDGEPSFVVANLRDVTAQVELEDQLRHAQKMEAVGRLAGGVAHDFNNLLLVIGGYAALALEKVGAGGDGAEEIREVIGASAKAADLTSQLLAFSRRQVMNPETLDLGAIVGDMVRLLRRLIGEHVELTTVWPDEPTLIVADKTQIEQVIANLAVNARDAMPGGGELSIEVARSADRQLALLVVRDTGTGIDAVTAAQIFEPFFTTKGMEGTGLGLSMVHGIVNQSGGQIAVDSEPGRGTAFTISLPLVQGNAEREEAIPALEARGGSETVLLVEDEPAVRAIVARILGDHGYRLLVAQNGAEGIAHARAASGAIDLVLTDLVMPGLSGRDTAAAVSELKPGIKVLFMSGYTDDAVLHFGGLEPGVEFLQKPFSAEELAHRVRSLLDGAAPAGG